MNKIFAPYSTSQLALEMGERAEVDYTHSGIENVPHLVYPDATKLCLRRNRIKSLPDTNETCCLPNVTAVDLYDNLIPKLPRCFGKLPKLTSLDLSFNLIEKIEPDSLSPTIRHLYLSANRISEFPDDALRHLGELRTLELGANQLKSLPDNSLSFERLEELWLSGNQISNNSAMNFSHLPRLRILSLQCNKLEGAVSIAHDSLLLPASIEELYLGENKITHLQIESGLECPLLPHLRTLDLGHNELTSLSESISTNCPELNNFWINDNKISNLEQALEVVKKMTLLSNFFFIRNPCTINLPAYHIKTRLACPKITELDGLPVQQ